MLELLHLGQDTIPDLEEPLYPFKAQDHSFGFGGADSHGKGSAVLHLRGM